jgi:acetyl-CoA C-acetyltransferase
MHDDDVVVVALARTPFGRFRGSLSALSATELGVLAMHGVLDRAGVAAETIDCVYAGIGMLGGATMTAARQAILMSRLPEGTPSMGVDRVCCSGMTAIGLGYKDIRAGSANAVLCGGFESLSNTPLLYPRGQGSKIGTVTLDDPLLLRAAIADKPIAVYSGEEAVAHGIDRQQQDEWALASHAKYFAAEMRGFFAQERIGVHVNDGKGKLLTINADESPRADSSLEKLAALTPIYGGLTVTAGNAPGLNDGAAFLMLMRARSAKGHALKPLATLMGYAQMASGPTKGTSTPALSIMKVLAPHGVQPDALDLIEINEAYAATPLVSTLVLADGNTQRADALRTKTNVHGGAVAIGHPLGASGARIVMTLIAALRERGGGTGAAAICGGFGQGDALLLKVDAG